MRNQNDKKIVKMIKEVIDDFEMSDKETIEFFEELFLLYCRKYDEDSLISRCLMLCDHFDRHLIVTAYQNFLDKKDELKECA